MKKGFTLIELLAVIVILAVIALIAAPIITGIIDDTKNKSSEQSVNGLMDAINNYYISTLLKIPKQIKGKIILFNNDGTAHFEGEEETIDLNYKGQKPTGGKIYIDASGNLTAEGLIFDNNIVCNMSTGENGCIHVQLDGNKNVTDNDAISYIKSKAGLSLVDDPSDDKTRMIFRGDNDTPNYINIIENNNPIKYRIVSIESDGTIKVVRDDIESKKPWDETSVVGKTSTTGPRLNDKNTYCMEWDDTIKSYTTKSGIYYGCNAWNAVDGIIKIGNFVGTVKQNASLNDYLNKEFYNKLDKKIQKLIITHSFDTGEFHWQDNYNIIKLNVKQKSWQGKIGLLTALDWFNASDATTNCTSDLLSKGWYNSSKTNINSDHIKNYPCSDKNYLYKKDCWWTITSDRRNRMNIFDVGGFGGLYSDNSCYSCGVRPTFYITSNIKLTGEGTFESPFEIK